MFAEFSEGGAPLLKRLMPEQMFSFPIMAFTPLGGFAEAVGSSTKLHGFGKDLLLKKGSDGDVLIQPWPVDADPVANESPVSSLMRRGVAQARKPIEGDTDFSTVQQKDVHHVFVKADRSR